MLGLSWKGEAGGGGVTDTALGVALGGWEDGGDATVTLVCGEVGERLRDTRLSGTVEAGDRGPADLCDDLEDAFLCDDLDDAFLCDNSDDVVLCDDLDNIFLCDDHDDAFLGDDLDDGVN